MRMLGGRPTAAQRGLHTHDRDKLWAKISATPEGSLFAAADVAETLKDFRDFETTQDSDHIHLVDGLHTAIVETKHLRRLPKMKLLLAALGEHFGEEYIETGDWRAWRLGVREWEPIAGHRFYSNGPDRIVGYGSMKLRFLNAPSWARSDDLTSNLAMSFLDTPERQIDAAIARALKRTNVTKKHLEAAAAWLKDKEPFWEEDKDRTDPATAAEKIRISLSKHAEV